MSRLFVPHAYQDDIIQHQLTVLRGSVWAGMGMGKTSSTLITLDHLQLEDPGPALVLAPLRVANSTWPDEVAKWTQLSARHVVQPITGALAQRQAALKRDASVFTINYDNLPWLIETLNGKWPFRCVVADEATRLKGFRLRQGTKRAKALARVAHSRVDRWINLTGTPAPNGLKDVWGQQWFVDAGTALGRTFTDYENRWFGIAPRKDKTGQNTGYVQRIPFDHSQREIEERLRPTTVSIRSEDYFSLEAPIVRKIPVKLPPKARALYTEMEKRMFMELDGFGVEAVHAAAKTMKCLQIASGAAYVDGKEWREIHDAKLEALESVLEEAAGMPILVAYHWQPDLHRLMRAFPQGRSLDADPRTITEWNEGKIPILFAHPQSAGHGLNLQDGGNIVVYFSQWWDLEQHDQILERIGPMRQLQAGHKRNVFIYYIVAEDTMDETVMLRRESKRSVQSLLIEAMRRRGL